ncbi:hypothetical protein [Cyanobium sp. Cruz-8H5]|uniref:hypothetical protein n=1 Tax=Cyanobium sp. Cruz-8H5 TaxID=2823712 RepID=UPI0020CF6374|nr:hypothetical protein [Cyanobium sp. Cruz-8H5]MCP9859673.1 hypothetical protein [Cyanobium sp. Cruz-8H5]
MSESKRDQSQAGDQAEDLISRVRQQSEVILDLRSQLSTQISMEIANSTMQLETHQALQALVGDVLSSMHECPISTDFALKLVHKVREESYDLIIEFGSGSSTLLILRALELLGSERDTGTHGSLRLLSFEHSERSYQNTADLVSRCGNHNQLKLLLASLCPWSDSTGKYSYYSCIQSISETLRSLNGALSQSDLPCTLKLLVLINSPSKFTGRWARYPAVPLVLNACSSMDAAIDFLLDDMLSDEGMEVSLAWEEIFASFGLDYQREDLGLQKGGLLLKLKSLAGVDTSQDRRDELLAERHDQEAIASEAFLISQLFTKLEVAEEHSFQELQQAHTARDAQAAQLQTLADELGTAQGERDALGAEKEAAQKAAADLQQKLHNHIQALQQAQQDRDEQVARVQALEAEVVTWKSERDALGAEKEAAQKAAADLQQKLHNHIQALQQAQQDRDEQVARVQALEAELGKAQGERDALGAEKQAAQKAAADLQRKISTQREALQRLRHLARPLATIQQ